jgi:hypothetical protein
MRKNERLSISSPIAQSDDKAHALFSQVEREKEKADASKAQTLRRSSQQKMPNFYELVIIIARPRYTDELPFHTCFRIHFHVSTKLNEPLDFSSCPSFLRASFFLKREEYTHRCSPCRRSRSECTYGMEESYARYKNSRVSMPLSRLPLCRCEDLPHMPSKLLCPTYSSTVVELYL